MTRSAIATPSSPQPCGCCASGRRRACSEVADASGVGRTTLYRHFASRDELIGELQARVAIEGDAIVRRTLSEDGPALEVLERLCRRLVELGDRYRFLVD